MERGIFIMKNRYFQYLDNQLHKRGNWFSRYRDHRAINRFLNTVSPSYDDMFEMVQFIKLLEFSYLYPNDTNLYCYGDSKEKYKCPIAASINADNAVIEINPWVLTNIDSNRFSIEITLYKESGTKMIGIKIKDSKSKTKRPRSEIKFPDGEYTVGEEEIFEMHMFNTILEVLAASIKWLLDLYTNKIHLT